MEKLKDYWQKVNRKKKVGQASFDTTGPLHRCLTTFDLTLLGLSHTVGAGIFVLSGTIARTMAGPGITLSYVISGISALFSALCYAEFSARVPWAGSAYSYSYVIIGELWAFLIGWNIVLEQVLTASAAASAFSGIVDSMTGYTISNFTATHIGTIHAPDFVDVPDILGFAMVILVATIAAVGSKFSARFNNVFNAVAVSGVIFITILGFIHADPKNWTNRDHGGFLPFGMKGVLSGAGAAFVSYMGFDSVASASEEAKDPKKSLPIAIMVCISISIALYTLASGSLTLMVPYYDISISAPFSEAFADAGGRGWARYLVGVISAVAVTGTCLSATYAISRAVYAMSSDGMFFSIFAKVHPRTQTPLLSILVFSGMSSLFALLVSLEALADMISIGTIFAYSMVAASLILVRYRSSESFAGPNDTASYELISDPDNSDQKDSNEASYQYGQVKPTFQHLPVLPKLKPLRAVGVGILAMIFFMTATALLVLRGSASLSEWWAILLLCLFVVGVVFSFFIISVHVQNNDFSTFKVPAVPLIPSVCIFINIFLLLQLSLASWIRTFVWEAIGLVIYIAYGIRHSTQAPEPVVATPVVKYGTDGTVTAATETMSQQPPSADKMMLMKDS